MKLPLAGEGERRDLAPQAKRPLQVLQRAVNKLVLVKLKSDFEYRGVMESIDPYMNIILTDASEYNSGSLTANYGRVVIRGNNVLFVKIEDGLT
jgi:small nuclear ribonucleoprotein